ncbi:hypothetical protein JCM3775_006423 [Rhodotorula graminis]
MAVRRRLSLNRHPSTAPRLPDFLQRSSVWNRISAFSAAHLNFYRLHLLTFIFVPLIMSGIFYASNGPSEENQIAYVDALFMVVSAMTVTGLNSVLFVSMTLWQQVIIFFMMTIGSTSFVSIIVIVIRRQFFRNKFEYMVANDEAARKRVNDIGAQEAARHGRAYQAFDDSHRPGHTPWFTGLLPVGGNGGNGTGPGTPLTPRPTPIGSAYPTQDDSEREREKGRSGGDKHKDGAREKEKKGKRKKIARLTADMIKRVDVPVRVNEMSVSGRLGGGRSREGDTPGPQSLADAGTTAVASSDAASEAAPVAGNLKGGERSPRLGNDEVVRGVTARLERVAGEQGEERGRPRGVSSPPSPDNLPDVFTDEEDAASVAQEVRPRHFGEAVQSPETASLRVDDQGSVAGHQRAIQIDESARPPRNFRGRRSSDSAASPHRAPGAAFPRTRTLDHRHLQGITESPSSIGTPTSPTFRHRDLEMGHTRTIEFRDADDRPDLRMRRNRTIAIDPDFPTPRRGSHSTTMRNMDARTFTRTTTLDQAAMHTGFGGFPNPLVAVAGLARQRIPAVRNVFDRNLTMPRTTTMMSTHSHGDGAGSTGGVVHAGTGAIKPVSYISFDAIVGRNSKFHGLTNAQQEELGGVEFRALTVLLRIVVAYWLGMQLLAVLVLAPWLSRSPRWDDVIQGEWEVVNSTWFVFFQVWSAFSNNGMSTVDASMVPFQRCYWLIIVMSILILGGNTAFPIFLRLVIWTFSKVVPRRSQLRETLQFLLDHPRRCFIYLFPSHQTWFLVFTLVCLNGIDWACFLVLDIGNPVIEAIPVGTRVIDGLLQAFAVRAAGFSIVSLSSVAPALQFLYVIMMYIAVYPIAVSIRATNVYEEKSMGVYDEDFDEDPDDAEARFEKSHSATQYIGYHARKQLAFDLWWLGLAVWLICIVERHRLGSTDWPEVSIFTLIFEITSAYGTVGLSLGNTRTNTSLAGVLSPLSKLIIIAVMIRGRHRGLPIAIDRAVLLPSDLAKHGDDTTTVASAEPGGGPGPGDFVLRSRGTRSSFGSHQAPVDAGGLDAVAPLTDAQRSRQASAMVGSGDDMRDADLGLASLGESPNEKSESTGASATDSSESIAKRKLDDPQPEPPHDRNQEGWR